MAVTHISYCVCYFVLDASYSVRYNIITGQLGPGSEGGETIALPAYAGVQVQRLAPYPDTQPLSKTGIGLRAGLHRE